MLSRQQLEGPGGFECPDPEDLVFYWHEYLPGAEEPRVFEEVVKRKWPILTFAVDPAVDEQNIDEAASVHRELQLAVAFAFAAGRSASTGSTDSPAGWSTTPRRWP